MEVLKEKINELFEEDVTLQQVIDGTSKKYNMYKFISELMRHLFTKDYLCSE